MSLNTFLHLTEKCPVCDEPMTLFMQVLDSSLWRSYPTAKPYITEFQQFKMPDENLDEKHSILSLVNENDSIDILFSSSRLYQMAKKWNLFFFYLCNEAALEDNFSKTDYTINPYLACYYRASPFMEFKKNKQGDLVLIPLEDTPDSWTKDEIFTFKIPAEEGKEKVYIMSLDQDFKKTFLRYYVTTPYERKIADFEPKTFKKELPLLNTRPNLDLSKRGELIARLDSWIIMS